MCMKVDCSSCGKATWKGCGQHVQATLGNIPTEDRCPNWMKGAKEPCDVGNVEHAANNGDGSE
eukprot:CAMPEP_0201278564 /NCGR_PEP_ID=MMETSP0853-20130426/60203_1 /ASSEMBLY_ACC=CAM_ASM_000640 /TAXON_ID=183588 /ORGANISM="Pseudo-nitzschia fraudulenta, Strain WWA7" /LENGTH=62 /DNA_ID=CAMNT_0047586893 /DNA_START=1245 /DNA_END=1433 /DNA_ORIENTATION=-